MRLRIWDSGDEERFASLFSRGNAVFDSALTRSIGALVDDVRHRGDAAVLDALMRFDHIQLPDGDALRVDIGEMEAAHARLDPGVLDGVRAGIANVRAFNEALIARSDWRQTIAPGLEVGERATPIASAGLFVPAGKGSFPSVLMQLGVPALVAGVPHIAVVTPPRPEGGGEVDHGVLAVAYELGLTEVYRTNGPAGIAALAFGTVTLPRVRKVLGPGSPAVQAAQIICQAHGCHTQMMLGPTESVVIADGSADPALLAADLLTEAEHGPDSSTLLVTTSVALVEALQQELTAQLEALPGDRARFARGSISDRGGAVLVQTLDDAVDVVNRFAPEHLQIVAQAEERILSRVLHAGEILLGQCTPFAAANFALGVPAALPTGGFAEVIGGVTAETFMKKTSIARAGQRAMHDLAPGIVALAEHEGFPAHAAAIRRRDASAASTV